MSNRPNLPLRDRRMAAILMGAMLVADIAAAATGRAWDRGSALVIMPATLVLIWACYRTSLLFAARKPGQEEASKAMSGFMGRTLSLVAAVMTIAHMALVAFAARWIEPLNMEAVLRIFMVGLSLALIVTHNRMPKVIAPHCPPKIMAWTRLASWVGVVSGGLMIVLALTLPIGDLTVPLLILAFIPTIITLYGTLTWWLDRRKAG
jgi:hypothetical protein